jgi:hypothetical protein
VERRFTPVRASDLPAILTQIGRILFPPGERIGHHSRYCGEHEGRQRRMAMPLLLPVLIGIPVVIGGGWVIYKIIG